MNSFDAWDTLVTRRFMRDEWYWRVQENKSDPKGFELANLVPIMENVSKVRPGDWVVSDYGDGTPEYANFLDLALRSVCKLSEFRLRVTPAGKITGGVWGTLPEKPQTHTGDNPYSDVDSPQKHGIHGVLSQLASFTEPEQFISDNGFPSLAKLCREARLRTFDINYRGIEILQCDYNFPTLFLGSILLNRIHPTGMLLMSSRDSYMWQKLMQKLFNRGEYWYSSIIARNYADEAYHRYIQSFGPNPVLVDLCGTGTTFSKLPYPSILLYKSETGVPTIPSLITSWDCPRLEQANAAPEQKCIGVTAALEPIFQDSGIDNAHEPHTQAQVKAFGVVLTAMDHYDLSQELLAPDESCKKVMHFLMHKYIDFKDYVEPLRLIAIREDEV